MLTPALSFNDAQFFHAQAREMPLLVANPGAEEASTHGAVVLLGNFDGLHRGHRYLVDIARARAAALDQRVALLSMCPHPRRFFRPNAPPFELDCDVSKIDLLWDAHIDLLVAPVFDEKMAATSALHFILDFILSRLRPSHVVVGPSYRFGRGREGDIDFLSNYLGQHDIGVTIGKSFTVDGELCSSSAVRAYLAAGDVAGATRLLGRPWRLMRDILWQSATPAGKQIAEVRVANLIALPAGRYLARVSAATEPIEERSYATAVLDWLPDSLDGATVRLEHQSEGGCGTPLRSGATRIEILGQSY